MTDTERDSIIERDLTKHADILKRNNAIPLLSIGVGKAGGPCPGKFVVSLVGAFSLEETFKLLEAMKEDVAEKLGIT